VKVIDFRNHRSGTVVARSAHWFKTRSRPKVHPDRKQLGIITDLDFYEDGTGQILCYPIIHWEGQHGSSMTHPANVRLYRKPATPVQYVETDGS
jgi:hypothetical protein